MVHPRHRDRGARCAPGGSPAAARSPRRWVAWTGAAPAVAHAERGGRDRVDRRDRAGGSLGDRAAAALSDADSAALAAAIRGNAGAALTDARAAAADDPVSIDPLYLLVERSTARLGDAPAARRELVDATSRQPSNPAVWEQLGCYDLGRRKTGAADAEFQPGAEPDPGQTQIADEPGGVLRDVTPGTRLASS